MPCSNISQFSLLSPISVPQTDSSELLIRAENSGGGERREERGDTAGCFVVCEGGEGDLWPSAGPVCTNTKDCIDIF